jgi:diadenosine tetraphosphatase ApaH/serine/threonine PP2A family protein phosphatase
VRAILSDIHGNFAALDAVLADIIDQGTDVVYNLGDTLGYGPDPIECLQLAQCMDVVLMGNFEKAVLHGTDGFCRTAEDSVLWTRAQLAADSEAGGTQWMEYLKALPECHREGDTLFVHGSARDPTSEYVFPEDIHNARKMTRIGEISGPLCFAGHTHLPGIFAECGVGKWEFINPEECDQGFPVAGQKLICNVGSVGQPRDLDERACYVLFDGYRIWFRRVEYDIEATVRKIYEVPELSDFLGDRLREGR